MLNFFLLIIGAVLAFFSINFGGEQANMPTPEPTQMVAPTSTPTPSPAPTPTLSPIEQKEAEINQEIQGFLNSEGDYRDFNMDLGSLVFPGTPKHPEGTESGKPDLGIIDYRLDLQGCLIDYIDTADYIFLIVGFENNQGGRFVTTLAIVRYFHEGRESQFIIIRGSKCCTGVTVEENYNHEVLLDYLNRLKGRICGFPLMFDKISEQSLRKNGLDFDWVPRYVEEVNNSTEFARRLLNTVATNDLENRISDIDSNYIGIWKESIGKIEPILGLEKIDYEQLNGLDVPFVLHLLHYNGINTNE